MHNYLSKRIERQFRSHRRRYEEEGLQGLFDKWLGKASAPRGSDDIAATRPRADRSRSDAAPKQPGIWSRQPQALAH